MAQFIFYTLEGHTISPNNVEVENLQILGVENGFNSDEALEKLTKDNKWIKESGFSKDKIKNYATVSASLKNDIKTVIDYLWNDEEKHFEESKYDSSHIFKTLQRLKEIIC